MTDPYIFKVCGRSETLPSQTLLLKRTTFKKYSYTLHQLHLLFTGLSV